MFENLREYMVEKLPEKIVEGGYNNYEIFGKEAEKPISDVIEDYLNENNTEYSAKRARNKNEFPDLELTCDGKKIALEHKVGVSDIKGEKKSSAANDMGTINAYPEKIEKYNDDMYCTFVKYSVQQDDTIKVEDVYFDKIYKFIGKGTGFDNQLQYREKDGNLRPKNWAEMENDTSHFNTLEEFNEALKETDNYRSERIAIKHIDNLDVESIKRIQDYIDGLLEDE